MKYLLDLVIVALIIGCAVAGSRKGAVRMLISLVGYVVAFATAMFVSNIASEYVYENLIKQSVISSLQTKAESLGNEYLSSEKINEILKENGVILSDKQILSFNDNDLESDELLNNAHIRESLYTVFTEYCEALTSALTGTIPEEIIEEAERYLDKNNLETEHILKLITQEKESVIKIIESEIIRPVMMKTVKAVLFSIVFAVCMIIVAIISYAAKVVKKIPLMNSADSFLGTIIGLLQGILYTMAINLCVNMFINFTSDTNEYINTMLISETYVFKLFYNGTLLLIAMILN